jgi:hypothetical protein
MHHVGRARVKFISLRYLARTVWRNLIRVTRKDFLPSFGFFTLSSVDNNKTPARTCDHRVRSYTTA